MKTKEQILKWLDEQPWANEFYKTAFLRRINLYNDDRFISCAFIWEGTEEGKDVWEKRDEEFRKWYEDYKPKSWEEYCEQNPITDGACYIDNSSIVTPISDSRHKDADNDVNVMSKDLCEAFLAYMKLIQLRNAWVKDCDKTACCFKIKSQKGEITDGACPYFENGLSFPMLTMADEFMDTFKDLLEVAKPLL